MIQPMLAVIPARGGSKGLPGKNIRPLAGLPLIVHAIRFARMVPAIARCIVSTDSEAIAAVAREAGADVPFLRPAELAGDDAAMTPVLRHALATIEAQEGRRYESLLLVDPTSPGRLPTDVTDAVAMLEADARADGVVAVSEPRFNPRWVCVEPKEGYMHRAFDSVHYERRQDVPPVYRINGTLYLWRRDFLMSPRADHWLDQPHKLLIIPEDRAVTIDSPADFQIAEFALQHGWMTFPWLAETL